MQEVELSDKVSETPDEDFEVESNLSNDENWEESTDEKEKNNDDFTPVRKSNRNAQKKKDKKSSLNIMTRSARKKLLKETKRAKSNEKSSDMDKMKKRAHIRFQIKSIKPERIKNKIVLSEGDSDTESDKEEENLYEPSADAKPSEEVNNEEVEVECQIDCSDSEDAEDKDTHSSHLKKKSSPHKSQSQSQQKKNRKKSDSDDAQSDVESSMILIDDSDESPELEDLEEEEYSEEDGVNSIKSITCNICYHQNLLPNNKAHFKSHEKSEFVSHLMKESFGKARETDMIFCKKCHDEGRTEAAVFHQSLPLRHIFNYHIEDFNGNEKELLKQIDFFSIVEPEDPNFNDIVEEFEITHSELEQFAKVYYSHSEYTKNEKVLIMGKLYLRLQKLAKSKGAQPHITDKIKGWIDEYLKLNRRNNKNKESPIKKDSKTKELERFVRNEMEEKKHNNHHKGKIFGTEETVNKNFDKRSPRDLSDEPLGKKIKPNENPQNSYLPSFNSLTAELNFYIKKYAESKLVQEELERELTEKDDYIKKLEEKVHHMEQKLEKKEKKR